jgi:hypothetical protein
MVEYTGFIQDPLEPIVRLRNDLGDRYQRGFPVLKELIQNADDAQATHVTFGLVSGIDSSRHPLLGGRGLYFINNGIFEPRHETGIRLYGTSNKVTERAAVGKFGLGMKSVFHFCEAFFFLAHLRDGNERAGLINPWSVPEHLQHASRPVHPAWVSPSDDDVRRMRDALSDAVANIPLAEDGSSFILWLPLRSDRHLWENGEKTGVIVPEYPGDSDEPLQFLGDRDLPALLAELLPLLRRVEAIRFQPLMPWDQGPFRVQVEGPAERIRFLDASREADDLDFHGTIRAEGASTGETSVRYFGRERFRWSEKLTTLNESDHWPQNNVLDNLGKPSIERDKAEPHAAAVLTTSACSTGQAKLTFRWAVFLPLDENLVSESVPIEGNRDYCVTLHGYLFVDAGRRGIHGFDVMGSGRVEQPLDSVDAVRVGWNEELATRGTLVLLLPVLQRYVESLPATERVAAGRALAEALNRSKLWARFQGHIVDPGQWVLGLDRKGAAWKVVHPETGLLPLPAPPETEIKRPWEVFPILEELEEAFALVVATRRRNQRDATPRQEPQLTINPRSAPNPGQLSLLLDSVPVREAFEREGWIRYLAETLELGPREVWREPNLISKLVDLLRSAIDKIGLRGVRSNRTEAKRLTSLLPSAFRLAVRESLPDALLDQLATCDLPRLILPSDLLSEDLPQASLARSDAEPLLRLIAAWIQQYPTHAGTKAASEQALALLNLTSPQERPGLLRALQDAPFARGYDAKAKAWQPLSPRVANKAKEEGLLFKRAQVAGDQDLNLARRLQSALADQTVLVLEGATLEALAISPSQVRPCDAKGLIYALGNHPHRLAEPAKRLDLLRTPIDPGDDVAAIRGLRFLLHGHEGRWSDIDTTLWFRESDENPAWEKLWGQFNQRWNLVDAELAQQINGPVRQALGLGRIRAGELLDAVAIKGVGCIDATIFTAQECVEILNSAHDEVVWRMLPLHECIDGTRVAAQGSSVYRDTGLPVPKDLADNVSVVDARGDEQLRQRYTRFLPPFDRRVRIQLMLCAETPARLASLILADLEALGEDLCGELETQVATTKWIPGQAETAFAPSDVIDCEDPSNLIRDLSLEAEEAAYTHVNLLSSQVRDHEGLALLRRKQLLAQGDTALETLGLLLVDLPKYHLGKIPIDDSNVARAISALSGLPPTLGLPGWRLLDSLARDYDVSRIVSLVARELAKPVEEEAEIICSVLDWIRQQGRPNESQRAAYDLYLTRFAELPDAKSMLGKIWLIDAAGHWRLSGDLCTGIDDVDRRFVLCDGHRVILQDVLVSATVLPVDRRGGRHEGAPASGAELARLLQDFFAPWCDKVAEPLIGCFVMACGDVPEVKELVEQYRGGRSQLREWLLTRLPWAERPDRTEGGLDWARALWKDPEEALGCCTISAIVAGNDEAVVSSILGESLVVQRKSRTKSFVTVTSGDYQILIQFAPIDVGKFTGEELSSMLKGSIRLVVEQWADGRLGDLSGLWAEVEASDQIAIRVSRSVILDHLPVLAMQLKRERHPALDQALRAFDKAHRDVVEYEDDPSAAQLEKEKRQRLGDLQQVIECNASARASLLQGVRNKIGDYQYRPDSVPFELFQNADDAVREAQEIAEYVQGQPCAGTGRFVVYADGAGLTFLHWGRPLNATGDPFPGRERGYHRDLEKMLIMNASDKDRPSTGKYGLGFKSVFLVTEEPEIVSGRLSSKILGGMLPMALHEDGALKALLREHGPAGAGAGTAIRLPMDPANAESVLRPFQVMAGMLCCLAKAIDHIDFAGGESYAWSAVEVPSAPRLRVGALVVPDDGGAPIRVQALRIALDGGALVLRLGGRGCERLPAAVPTIWVLAPTNETESLGFALNGPFEVDVGRTQLADKGDANAKVATVLGDSLHAALEQLADASAHRWDETRRTLGLQADVEPYDLWLSLWQVLAGGLRGREGSRVRSASLRVMERGLGVLAGERAIVPNGLPSAGQALLRSSEIRIVLRGALTLRQVLGMLGQWSVFCDAVDPEHSVTAEMHELVALTNRTYASSRAQWKSLRLCDLVARLSSDDQVLRQDIDSASILGAIFDALDTGELAKDECDDLDATLRLLRNARFRSAAGTFGPAAELLDGASEDKEERLRSAFAPAENRLSLDYDVAGRALLRRSRGSQGFSANAEMMARWIRASGNDPERCSAALVYLRDGECAAQVVTALHQQGFEGTWLSALGEDVHYFDGWDDEQTLRLLAQLEPIERVRRIWEPGFPDPQPFTLPSVDVAATLSAIQQWWADEADHWLERYEQRVYPGGAAPKDALLDEHPEDLTGDRSAWLTLFMLGHFHTLGLVGHAQNRGFIETCQRQGWWDRAFAKPRPEMHPDDWMKVLDEYIDSQTDQQTYEHWMQRFPAIYRLARHLDAYRELMLRLPSWNWALGECRIDQVTRPRTASALRGGGLAPPPIHKTLGIGACFVVRELLRLGVVSGDGAPHACAYVPTKAVRDVFVNWGYSGFDGAGADVNLSKRIHQIVAEHLTAEGARFGGAYDIPLQLFATEVEVRDRCTVLETRDAELVN